jgi:hypothetical protein
MSASDIGGTGSSAPRCATRTTRPSGWSSPRRRGRGTCCRRRTVRRRGYRVSLRLVCNLSLNSRAQLFTIYLAIFYDSCNFEKEVVLTSISHTDALTSVTRKPPT